MTTFQTKQSSINEKIKPRQDYKALATPLAKLLNQTPQKHFDQNSLTQLQGLLKNDQKKIGLTPSQRNLIVRSTFLLLSFDKFRKQLHESNISLLDVAPFIESCLTKHQVSNSAHLKLLELVMNTVKKSLIRLHHPQKTIVGSDSLFNTKIDTKDMNLRKQTIQQDSKQQLENPSKTLIRFSDQNFTSDRQIKHTRQNNQQEQSNNFINQQQNQTQSLFTPTLSYNNLKILINQLQADLEVKMDKLLTTRLNQQTNEQSDSPTSRNQEQQVPPKNNQSQMTQVQPPKTFDKQTQSLPQSQKPNQISTNNQASQQLHQSSQQQQQQRSMTIKTTISPITAYSIKHDISLLDHNLPSYTQQDVLEAIDPFIKFARNLMSRNLHSQTNLTQNNITILNNSYNILRKYFIFQISLLEKLENIKFVPHNQDILQYLYQVQSVYHTIFIHGRNPFDQKNTIKVQEIKQPDDKQQQDMQRNWESQQKITQALLQQRELKDSFSEEDDDEYDWEDY